MNGSRRRAFFAVGGTTALAIALAACGGTSNNAGSGSSTQTVDLKMMVGGLNKQIYLPNMLAKQLGYFDEQKINVTLIDEGSGQGTEDEVVAGNVDAGSGAYSHPVELNAKGKKIETICQFGIAPGEAEMVASKKADSIKTAADLKGKNLGVTSIGSGTHTISLALLGRAGLTGTDAKFVAVGAGNTFIAAMQQHVIDAGMTTEPTISRLVKSGVGKVLIDLRTPTSTRAALGADYPFIGIFMMSTYVSSHKGVVQRLVNAYVKTLKWMKAHTAAEITDKMPTDYYAGDKEGYVAALDGQKDSFTADGKMPAAGAQNALDIELKYVKDMKGATVDLSKTYTNDFANNAK